MSREIFAASKDLGKDDVPVSAAEPIRECVDAPKRPVAKIDFQHPHLDSPSAVASYRPSGLLRGWDLI